MRHARKFAVSTLALILAASAGMATANAAPPVQSYAMVVLTNAKAGRDAEFNDWYSGRHVHDVVGIPGFVSAQRFRWTPTAGAQAPKFRYYAQYSLESRDLDGAVSELFRRNGTPLLPSSESMDPDVYFAVYAPLAPTVKSPSKMTAPAGAKDYTMLVLTNAKPGRDEEFNRWYTEQHVHDVVKIPGFVSARRFRYAEMTGKPAPKYRYFAAYELATADLDGAVAELFKRNGTPLLPSSDAMDPEVYFAVYEKIGPAAHSKSAVSRTAKQE